MGSNGGLGTSSRTSSSYSSSGLHQHIISETNDLSDDNPICDEPLVTSSVEGKYLHKSTAFSLFLPKIEEEKSVISKMPMFFSFLPHFFKSSNRPKISS